MCRKARAQSSPGPGEHERGQSREGSAPHGFKGPDQMQDEWLEPKPLSPLDPQMIPQGKAHKAFPRALSGAVFAMCCFMDHIGWKSREILRGQGWTSQ